jgi:Ca2+/Na+ antiporter
MFRKPRLMAHTAYGFVLIAMIWICAIELFDLDIAILNLVALLFLCIGVLFFILTLVFNRRVSQRLA